MLLLLIKGKVRVIYDKIKGIKRHEGQKTVWVEQGRLPAA